MELTENEPLPLKIASLVERRHRRNTNPRSSSLIQGSWTPIRISVD